MSLVLGVAYKNFIILSNDSRVTQQYVDPVTLEGYGELVVTDLKHEKINRLTDKVFLTTTGWSDTGDIVRKELLKRVDKKNDVKECYEIAKALFSELKAGLVEGLNDEEQIAAKKMETQFMSYLVGFNHSGIPGLADIRFESYAENPTDERKGYVSLINGPEPDYDFQFRPAFNIPYSERTFNKFMERMIFVHANLSHYHKIQVSTDCNFHILINKGDSIECVSKTIETLDFYESFGLTIESQ